MWLGSFLDPYELVFRFRHFLLWNVGLIEHVLFFFGKKNVRGIGKIWFEITGWSIQRVTQSAN